MPCKEIKRRGKSGKEYTIKIHDPDAVVFGAKPAGDSVCEMEVCIGINERIHHASLSENAAAGLGGYPPISASDRLLKQAEEYIDRLN